jgi:hypothetical protein
MTVAIGSRGFCVRNFLLRITALRQFFIDVRGKRYKKRTAAYAVGADGSLQAALAPGGRNSN